MNELITDIKTLQNQTLNNLKNSKAKNTVRAYKSDFKDFAAFCIKHGFKNLPTEPKVVSLYLTYLSSKNNKLSTLRRRLVSIGMIHKFQGHYLDTKHPIIIENLMGIKRIKGSNQRGKKPLLISDLKTIIDQIDKENVLLSDINDEYDQSFYEPSRTVDPPNIQSTFNRQDDEIQYIIGIDIDYENGGDDISRNKIRHRKVYTDKNTMSVPKDNTHCNKILQYNYTCDDFCG